MLLAGSDDLKRVIVVHPETGEQLRYVKEAQRGGGRKPKQQKTGGHWARIYPDEVWRLMGLRGFEFRVLFLLIELTVPDREFRFVVKEIAETLGVTSSRVSQGIRGLQEHGVLIKLPGRRAWYLDPRIVWRGSDEYREQAITLLGLNVQNSGHPPEEEA